MKMQIQMSDRTLPLEHTLWLECFRGHQIDVNCIWGRKPFLLTRAELQDNPGPETLQAFHLWASSPK